jgi:glutamate synthase domain-containing protein 3
LHSSVQGKKKAQRCLKEKSPNEATEFHRKLIEKVKPAIEENTAVKIEMDIRNVHRTVGAAVSGQIVKKFGATGLPEGTVQMNFKGSAGQSFGAFLAPGMSMRLEGEVNDYMGKGMSGGRIVLVPPKDATFVPCENIICGNVVLYGATGGDVYINGIAGERFAVRNSGARAVVEGLGDHGCEYMTGGIVVVIGGTGKNFAAGMSGGIAYVYDETELFDTKCNLDMVDLESVWNKQDRQQLHTMLEDHVRFTGSPRAEMILDSWEARLPLFVKVMPIDYRKALMRIRLKEDQDRITVSATEEVFHG